LSWPGILGALLAIPFAGIIQVIVRDVWDHRKGRLKDEPTTGEEEVHHPCASAGRWLTVTAHAPTAPPTQGSPIGTDNSSQAAATASPADLANSAVPIPHRLWP